MPPQPRGWGQLITLRTGIATVVCENVQTIVTPTIAFWVPDELAYALALRTRAELRILYASPTWCERAAGPVKLTALLRELIERAVVRGYLDPQGAPDARLLDVIKDELAALSGEHAASALVFPRTPAIRAAVERSISVAEERSGVGALAAASGMSERTFVRYFVRETGLSPRDWLRRARLSAATIALASGASVTEAGLAGGYASTSAFIAAYRAVFGITPGRVAKEQPDPLLAASREQSSATLRYRP